jgi:hypothetical protein
MAVTVQAKVIPVSSLRTFESGRAATTGERTAKSTHTADRPTRSKTAVPTYSARYSRTPGNSVTPPV